MLLFSFFCFPVPRELPFNEILKICKYYKFIIIIIINNK